MSDRKRVNISIDPETYAVLSRMKEIYGFSNLCELIVSLVHILVDRRRDKEQRRYDLPDDDGAYIDAMFGEFAEHETTPDGSVPVRHLNTGGALDD